MPQRRVVVLPMEQHIFFTFPLIIEGTTEKALKFRMPLKSVDTRNSGAIKQKCILNTLEWLKIEKRSVT
jgi:hypothetical protein